MSHWTEIHPSKDFYRVLDPDGQPTRDPPDVDKATLRRMYRAFVRNRRLDEKVFRMQRRGEVSIHAASRGEEAIPIGSAAALEPGDWCFPTYRQTAAMLYWDASMARSIAGLMGEEPETIDEYLPDEGKPDVNFSPPYVPLTVNVTNAVGSAMADQFNDRDVVTMSYVGDGSTSEGDFHEALNFAGVFDAPAVTICHNNQWAISVPAYRQTAAETFAQKAEAHGIPYNRVDGNDVLAVYEKTREAVERARADEGPTFLECVTYRISDHNTADEDSVYRDDREAERWADLDPVDRFESYLRETGVMDDDEMETIDEAAAKVVNEAVDAARGVPQSDPQHMFDHHLHGQTWTERHQRAELRRELEGKNPFVDFDARIRTNRGHASDVAGETEQWNVVDSVRETLRQEMHRDDSVRLLGYDIGRIGGVYRATEGLYEEFGDDRVIDTPLSEGAILGTAAGMAVRGDHVVPEIQFMGFIYPAFGQIMYTIVKLYERSGGALEMPITVRIPYGGGIKSSEYHSESTETFFAHTPGVRVVCPSTPAQTKGLLAASIRHPDPVLFMEPKKIYRGEREAVVTNEYTLPIDEARIVREGSDVTVLTWGAMVRHAETAAEYVNSDVEIVDLVSLSPLDVATVLASVKRTGRCVVLHEARRTLGLGAELSALVNEYALDRLKAPVKRATGFDVHFPGHQTEDAYLPGAERAKHAIEAVVSYEF